uniref:Uncharacterized protein n=2 Tax=unclassified Caudoviricetes TaxID=2788787 RepID=A0A8S5PJZ4_9CAUD|nr:MAG TPA: hypothetical protein [Siphoviridae sp. ctOSJ35]DAE15986.1 MAG TPA: hypothetical protein [Siphoviridae sp. ctIOF8]
MRERNIGVNYNLSENRHLFKCIVLNYSILKFFVLSS